MPSRRRAIAPDLCQGLDRLVETALREAGAGAPRTSLLRDGRDVEEAVDRLATGLVEEGVALPWGLPQRATSWWPPASSAGARS